MKIHALAIVLLSLLAACKREAPPPSSEVTEPAPLAVPTVPLPAPVPPAAADAAAPTMAPTVAVVTADAAAPADAR